MSSVRTIARWWQDADRAVILGKHNVLSQIADHYNVGDFSDGWKMTLFFPGFERGSPQAEDTL